MAAPPRRGFTPAPRPKPVDYSYTVTFNLHFNLSDRVANYETVWCIGFHVPC